MYNLRYHLASLIAVFLALAVGLLLGTVVAERGMVSDQASTLVGDLQKRFDEISAQNKELEAGLKHDRAFAEDVVPLLTAGNLAGKNVAVIVGKGRIDGADAVTGAVTAAGGTAFVVTLNKPALGLDKAEPEGLAGYYQLRGVVMAAAGEALEKQVADSLVAEWRSQEPRALTDLLVADQLLSIESAPGTATVDAIVVVGAEDAETDPVALDAARAITGAGGVAVGAETSPSKKGVASVFAGERLSAVDHIGTAQGRLSLVWLLSGRAKGYYGSGDGALAYYPPLAQ